jgi:hypothetical protein
MYKTLFTDEWETSNENGNKINAEIHNALRPILQKYTDAGFSTVDLAYMGITEVSLLCAEMRLRRSMAKSKKTRDEAKQKMLDRQKRKKG